MIWARPITFNPGRPIGEEFKTSGGVAFYLHAPSGFPPDLAFTTDEASRIKVPIQAGIVYTFPKKFGSLWLYHANSHLATDAQLVLATGKGELVPGGVPMFAGSAGASLWAHNSTNVSGPTNVTPAPAAGKRQRILRILCNIPSQCQAAAAAEVGLLYAIVSNGVQVNLAQPDVNIPISGSPGPIGPPLLLVWYDFGPTGVLGDPGARLQITAGSNLAIGHYKTEVAYTEE